MGSFWQRRSVRICRVVFRWTRISVWLVILLGLMAVAELHWHGLPDFLKRPILQHLREQGFDAQFSSMRLGWGPSIVVENAFFQRSSGQPEPLLKAARADLEMTLLDLAHAKFALKSFEVYDGKLQFPAAGKSNTALAFDKIHLELDFGSSNVVRLTNTMATFRGVRLDVDGELSHAEAALSWSGLGSGKAGASWQALLDRITDAFDHIHFSRAPGIYLDINGDARDFDSLRGHLSFTAPDVATQWGDGRKIRLEVACSHVLSTNEPILRIGVRAEEIATPWAQGSGISLTAVCSKDGDFNIQTASRLSAEELDGNISTNEVRTSGFRWDGTAVVNGTNFHLMRARGDVQIGKASTPWASVENIHLRLDGETNDPPTAMGQDWGFWAKLAPYRFSWIATGTNIDAPKLQLDSLEVKGDWQGQVARISQVDCKLYQGRLSGSARVDVATREVAANATANFDAHQVTQLLTPAARHWLSQYDWQTPPDVSAALSLTMPVWTNRHPDWRGEVQPTVRIGGAFSAPHGGSFRGVPMDSARSHFGYTNRVWTLPDLQASRSEGEVGLSYMGNEATHDYYFSVDSSLDPHDVKSLLPAGQQRWFDEVKFTTPPHVRGEVWGRWHAPELIGVHAEVSASNFVAHGESVDSFTTALDYTNRFVRAYKARLAKGSQYAMAGLAEVDLKSKKAWMTNVSGVVGPELLRRVSRPRTPKFLDYIQFDAPAAVALSGSFQFDDPLATDMHFDVQGKGFHVTNLLADTVSGAIQWRGRNVLLTNVQARLYDTGMMFGWCIFDYEPKHGTDFRCNLGVKDIDLPALAAGVSGRTNKLEGMLDGNLVMVDGNSTNQRSWNGYGQVHVHNAQLWDIKLFGIFSPILNAFSPGAGDSRAYEASADYAITNGVLMTDDLVVHSTGFRLNYSGTLDPATKELDARAEAELLRDTRVFGPLLSTLFTPLSRLFEYKITGPLKNPKIAPVYIPEPFMLLLRPFHTLKTLGESVLPGDSGASTNAASSQK